MTTPGMDAAAADESVTSTPKVSVGRQALRREVNQRIRLNDGEAEKLQVFCECGQIRCNDRLTASASMYDELRRVPTHFLVKRGHVAEDDRVVGEHEQFVIVEKFGRSGAEAVALDRGRRGR